MPVADLSTSMQCTLEVSGMDCASCAATIEKVLRRLDGVADVHVDVMGGRVDVSYAERKLARGDLARAIRRAGYGVAEGYQARVDGAGAAALRTDSAEQSGWTRHVRLILAVLAGVLWASSLSAAHLLDSSAAAAVLAIGAMVAGGWYIVPRGIRATLSGALDMNALMSLAAFGALLIGEYEEAATALFLFAIAQLLESHSMDRARNAVRALMNLSPAEATVLRDGREQRMRADAVAVGDIVLVRPGEMIAVDGVITGGRSAVDQAPITGESLPVDKEPGAEVFAGTLNGPGPLEVRSTKPASDTTLARIIDTVADAQSSRAPSQTFVDRFARVYTPLVVAAALALFLLPPLLGSGPAGEWFYRALVLLVVACPCALVISTPVTVVSALAGAARRGILIKGGLHLENAGRATILALDKTGTLTEGSPQVIETAVCEGTSEHDVIALAATAEARSEHPLARAVLRHAAARGIVPVAGPAMTAAAGHGVSAIVGDRIVHVGSERFFRELGADDEALRSMIARVAGAGRSLVLVGVAERNGGAPAVHGVIALADRVRPQAAAALRALHGAGITHIVMLTGDSEAAARTAAEETGVDAVRAGLLPAGKVAAIEELRAGGARVLMVGDGVNDAPALAAADVGIAMGSAGTDVALEAADIALMADDLSKLPEMVRFARKAERIIRTNIALSIVTKAAFVILAIAGVATLWMAVLADMGTSLVVIANGLRALRA